MGLDRDGVRLLFHGRSLGASFARSAMIGRQSLHLSVEDLARTAIEFGDAADETRLKAAHTGHEGFAEGLLHLLGADLVHSFDFSSYEHATHLHDMNQPIAEGLKGCYSAVIDGGSLEHVFNFPVAVKNCMEMLAVGGHYIGITPANNFFGHGFYQFSAETYFTVFSPDNGFEVVSMVLWETAVPQWYTVANPRVVGKRVTLVSNRPAYLGIVARRVSEQPVFAATPQQSDYVTAWKAATPGRGAQASEGNGSFLVNLTMRLVPQSVKRELKRRMREALQVQGPEDLPHFFKPFSPSDRPRP